MGECTCPEEVWTKNRGTDYEESLTTRQFDPRCPEHGAPDCTCEWAQIFGNWFIARAEPDCPAHGDDTN